MNNFTHIGTIIMPIPNGTVAITTQISLFKVQNCVAIDFLQISSVMLVTYSPDRDFQVFVKKKKRI